jgi:hypothetical protein
MSQPPIDPQRLTSGTSAVSELLREAERAYGVGLDEPRAWRRLESTWEKRTARPRVLSFAVYGLAAAFACWLVVRQVRHGSLPNGGEATARLVPSATAEPSPSVLPEPQAREEEPTDVTPSPSPRSLAEGRTRLTDGSIVRVSRASHAQVSAPSTERTRIDLAQGTVDLEVAHQEAGHSLEVAGGAYRFVALGTRFRVTVQSDRVALEVSEGLVGVVSGNKMLDRIGPSGSWTGPSATRPFVAPPAAPTGGVDCSELARAGRTEDALACFERLAAGDGTSAELALYEIARLRKDVLSDFAGALDALRRYQTKFPRGSLRGEVEVSIPALLEKLGKSREALSESEHLLSTAWGKERRNDIHLLRGNIYRQSLKDCARAIAEYEQVPDDAASSADDAQYWRAVCLEQVGQPAAAARAFESYLGRAHPRHAVDAKQRARALEK